MKKIYQKFINWYRRLPDKKRHIELITALLSVPMMLTVIIVNLNNIKSQKEKVTPVTNTTPIQVVVDNPNQSTATASTITPTATKSATPNKPECKKDIGPIEILSPQEGEVITSNNVCINISTDNNYCPVNWSYQLGNDSWSDYNNNDICLYNLTPGSKQLNIKIKSTVIDKTITLQRNFIYQTSSVSPTASASATNQ